MISSVTAPIVELEPVLSALLTTAGRAAEEVTKVVVLGGDGSNRRFWRLLFTDDSALIVIAPEAGREEGYREAAAVSAIGIHLHKHRVPVPEILAYDGETGILVCEDLDDIHLHDLVVATDWQDRQAVEKVRSFYHQALELLADMQIIAVRGFDSTWCWDTPRYDTPLMLARESGYFLEAFWRDMLGQEVPAGLPVEFERLAMVAAEAPAHFFLHRDYQSRNLMVMGDRIRVIDFQGGRLGPLGYDLASLLLDPYAALPVWLQEELYAYYFGEVLRRGVTIDKVAFRRWYRALSLQRNLQILGAFAFLWRQRNKPFFAAYIVPAVESLCRLSSHEQPTELEILHRTARKAWRLSEVLLGKS